DAGLGLRDQQAVTVVGVERRPGLERGEIVVEDEGRSIVGIAYAAGAWIARAKIAGGVVLRLSGNGLFFHLTLPGPLRAVRRHQHPFARERIEAAVGILRPVEHAPSC